MVFKCMSEDLRTEVAIYLLQKTNDGKLPFGAIREAGERFGLSDRSISNMWKLAKKPRLVGDKLDVKSGRIGNKNRKRILPDIEHIKSLDNSKRNTMKRVSKNCGVSVGTVHSWVNEGLLKPHSSPLHPKLSDLHKEQRLLHSLKSLVVRQQVQEFFDLNSIPFTEIIFDEMSNTIHMDEKWFFITSDNEKVYIVEGEEPPYRSRFARKGSLQRSCSFMCAISRPIYGADGELIFDGKIGMFPFKHEVPAARSSINRSRGAMETKPIDSITKQVVKDCLIHQVIPAIKSVWPDYLSKHIYIQQDNARPHIKNNDPDFMALQSLKSSSAYKTVDELVNEVMQAFVDYSPTKLNNIFLSLQAVMIEIMMRKGHNNFSLPHMGKGHLAAIDMLPRNLVVNEELVRECIEYMQGLRKTEGLENLMEALGYNVEG
ncbi:uncharacterized protein LOC141655644 [Silene latifolia]|uniref:uncharacterized protein LOC141655644 n=1 Tax=Silene latifolia TaxID=37657 RepID=UPI003D76D6F9